MNETSFDPRAGRLDGVQLIEASAGTGKTWTICALVLRLLVERRLTVDRILVVTFTNAATAELRARVRGRIVELRDHLRDAAPGDALIEAVAARARALWAEPAALIAHLDLALHGFDEAAIFTIHAFCQRALSGTPFSARVAAVQELIDDDGELRRGVVHDFWRVHVAGADPALAALLHAQGDTPERLDALLRRRVAQPLARQRWPDDLDVPDSDVGAELAAAHADAQRLWTAARDEIVATVTAGLDSLNGTVYKPATVAEAALDWDRLLTSDLPAPAAVTDGRARLFSAALLADKTKKARGARTPAHPFFEAAGRLLAVRGRAFLDLRRARLRLLRRFLDEGAALLRERKRVQRVVAFDDLLHDLWQRLVGAPLPGLAQALRQRHPAMLIDEFQDTDPLQFAIFSTLHAADPAAGPLFLVGDPKQAIYRFRHADLHAYFAARDRADERHTLLGNQRSDAGLIDAMNMLFTANPGAFMLPGLDYPEVGFGAKPRKPFVDASGSPPQPLHLWTLPSGDDGAPLPKPEARRRVLTATAAEIARLLAAARRGELQLDGRAAVGGDIAVLVRSHADGRRTRTALAAVGVGCIEHAQQSVLASGEAEELERCLVAIFDAERWALLRGALATSLLGVDAAGLLALEEESVEADALRERFAALRDTWRERGIATMLRRWFRDEGVARRLLAQPDGERRLTNLLHLAELLHRAAQEHPGLGPLLQWLRAERSAAAEGTGGEERQLRLESDRHLVQIVTVHKSKGLEYPIVFCPLLWDNGRRPSDAPPGIALNDENGQAVVDFRGEAGDDFDVAPLKAAAARDETAEGVRLLYVALTRAEHRCVLVTGSYLSRGRASESGRGLLNWLAAGAGATAADWMAGKPEPAEIDAAWDRLAAAAPAAIVRRGLPSTGGHVLSTESPAPEAIVVRDAPRVPAAWRMASFSSLMSGSAHDGPAADRDLRAAPPALERAIPDDIPEDDILRFPRGPLAGEVLHALFERVPFDDPAAWPRIAGELVAERGASLGITPAAWPLHARQMVQMLHQVLHTPIDVCTARPLVLAKVPRARRLAELEFHLPVSRGEAAALLRGLTDRGDTGRVPTLAPWDGYLTGSIDLVVEHEGAFLVLDWKSNHLGPTPSAYGAEPVAAAMESHGYHLQAGLYATALRRLLGARGRSAAAVGVAYLFVRGMRPGSATGQYIESAQKRKTGPEAG